MKSQYGYEFQKEGNIIAKGHFKPFNQYKIDGDTTIIYIERKNGDIFETYIDTKNLQKVINLGYCWAATYNKRILGYYAKASVYQGEGISNKSYYLHRIILGLDETDGREIMTHHKDGNTLNNREENLDPTTNAINLQLRNRCNTNSKTGVRNVHLVTRYSGKQLYLVQIMKYGERFKWEFDLNEFEEACEFARLKRIELFGKE